MILAILTALAVTIERAVQLFKPLWGEAALGKLSVTAMVSMALGILACVLMKLSVFASIPEFDAMMPVAVKYVMYVITGAATGGGASIIHDLWTKVNTYGK